MNRYTHKLVHKMLSSSFSKSGMYLRISSLWRDFFIVSTMSFSTKLAINCASAAHKSKNTVKKNILLPSLVELFANPFHICNCNYLMYAINEVPP